MSKISMCPDCKGRGRIPKPGNNKTTPCSTCGGKGVIVKN